MTDTNDILLYGDPCLRRKAESVGDIDEQVVRVGERLTAALERAGGLGLAAPQIGSGLRVICYDLGEGPEVIVNPEVVRGEGLETAIEGCLSLPLLYGEVPRATRVVVSGRNLQGRALTIEAEDMLARVLQHEVDHLEGVLFVDRVDPESLYWLVGADDQEGEPERVHTAVEDALKAFEAASRRLPGA